MPHGRVAATPKKPLTPTIWDSSCHITSEMVKTSWHTKRFKLFEIKINLFYHKIDLIIEIVISMSLLLIGHVSVHHNKGKCNVPLLKD